MDAYFGPMNADLRPVLRAVVDLGKRIGIYYKKYKVHIFICLYII